MLLGQAQGSQERARGDHPGWPPVPRRAHHHRAFMLPALGCCLPLVWSINPPSPEKAEFHLCVQQGKYRIYKYPCIYKGLWVGLVWIKGGIEK